MEFNIPVALIIFKRNKAVEIVKRIAKVKPKKLYILADQGRNEQEKAQALECRRLVEQAIDWDCEVIKRYAEENVGVYENIAGGAKWVLEREESAIFLEDDNLPEESFFPFCEQMLERYKDDEKILWICGTNYLGEYKSPIGADYVFTKHMLPCGWASWSHKFAKFYNGDLSLCENPEIIKKVAKNYCNRKVYKQYRYSWMSEYNLMKAGKRPASWDYQMDFSIKAHDLLGICPCNNQIKNIGVDEFSEHGGRSFSNEMTRRFCGMNSYPINFPLNHPEKIQTDKLFEKKIGKIILYPFLMRCRLKLARLYRKILKKGKRSR